MDPDEPGSSFAHEQPQPQPPPHTHTHTTSRAIVVTAPSSPESSPVPRNEPPRSLLASLASPSPPHDVSFHPMNTLHVPDNRHNKSHFDLLLEAADLPEPGPAHFLARQRLWRIPRPHASNASPQHPVFERFLKRRGGRIDSDEAWRSGLDKVWKGILSGAKLKQNMPLSYVIQILQAGWIQDGTWPRGTIVPQSDDERELQEDGQDLSSTATPTIASALMTPTTGPED